jgi:ribosomal-protein-alanine N-acetyltransferase
MAARVPPQSDPGELVVHIGLLRRRHLRSVMRIEALVYPQPWGRGIFLSELSQVPRARHYVAARIGGDVVGYAGLMFAVDDAHITTIAVDPDWQRSRIATRLLLHLVHEAIARGSTALTLEVRVSNDAAQALYRRFGFAPAGIRRNYYAEQGEDALVMWAHDIGGAEFRSRLAAIDGDLPGVTRFDPILTVALDERPSGGER